MRIGKQASVIFVLLSLVSFGQALGAQASLSSINHDQQQSGGSYRSQSGDAVLDSIVTILIEDDNRTQAVGSGFIVRGDGLILTAYHLIKGAHAVHVRLRSGETFERAELVATDERRNVAVLHIQASGLFSLPGAVTEESWVGSRVMVISNATIETSSAASGILSSVSLSDEIAGAGAGYRVLRFTAPASASAAGGLLVDERGHALGLLAASPQAVGQNYAVPLSSLVGLVGAIGAQPALLSARASVSNAPVPIPQNTVLVPQRPVSPLAPKGPGSVVVKPSRAVDVLLASKTIYVTTNTVFFKPEQLINELRKRAEPDQWGLSFVDDVQVADLILTLDHIVFTYKFTFTLSHQRTGVVVATGNVIIWDGNTGAEQMARRIIEKLTQVRAQAPTK